MQQGHRLLKEKRTSLIITFMEMAQEGKRAEMTLSEQWRSFLSLYGNVMTFMSAQALVQQLPTVPCSFFDFSRKKVASVPVYALRFSLVPPNRSHLRKRVQSVLDVFADNIPMLLKVIQLKINCELLSQEIIKTNRQINNVKKRLEGVHADEKYIKNALMEKSNFEKAILINLFRS
jgi:vacuolar-type H+-ATPase subunit D/Vma8